MTVARTIGIAGAGGFVGSALAALLAADGRRIVRFVRAPRAGGPDAIPWDPPGAGPDPAALAPLDAVVNLAGADLAGGRWTATRRRRLEDSRVGATAALARALAAAPPRPRTFVSVSAVGWYGDRGDEPLDEASPPGRGFLAELAQAWERAAEPAAAAGVRVVQPRLGLVLAPHGGVLARLLPVFRLGAGGPLGAGRQWWSWVTLADALRGLVFALDHPALAGPLNLVAPAPVRQREWATALARALRRPAFLPAPAFALRLLLGRREADQMLLAGQRVRPARLLAAGFRFDAPELAPALAAMLAGAAA